MTTGVGGVGGTVGSDAPEGMFLDLADPAFDTTSEQVHEAREADWLARTSYGFAVLRYEEANALLTDRRFRQGNARWPEQNGVTGGPFLDWWQRVLLSLDGDDHARLRRLLMPAFKRQAILAMQPRFVEIAEDLIAGFAGRGRVELIAEFAEPYSARILCLLLGLPEEEWEQVAHWADDLGRSFGIAVAQDLPLIEAALEGLTGYVEAAVDDRVAHPREDLVSTLVQAHAEDGRLTRDELVVGLVFLAFAGMETTRNQIGLAVQTLLRHPDQWRLLGERPDGKGVHHCLGHFVARTDMAVALPMLARAMPDAVADGPGEWLPVSGNTGALSYPIRFRAPAR